MKDLRTIFMGTGSFAQPALSALISAGYNIVAVYTKPERKAKKSRTKIPPNPVRTLAEEHNITIYAPTASLGTPDVLERMRTLAPDIIIVAAYGKILPQSILNLPRYSCINIHASLLPRWRGASPIHSAIRAGDTETGTTIMRMDAGLDTGPILTQRTRAIAPDVLTPELFDALAKDGAALLIETLPSYIAGTCVPRAQNESDATTCRTLTRNEGLLNWNNTTATLYNQFRALYPWPGVYAIWHRKGTPLRLKFTDLVPLYTVPRHHPSGTVFSLKNHPLCIATGDGALSIRNIQMEGKKAMDARTFINGYIDITTARLCEVC